DYRGSPHPGRALLAAGTPAAMARADRALARVLELPEVDAEALSFVCVSCRERGRTDLADRAEKALARLQALGREVADDDR
ncbi:MAG: hypothetical protein HZA54_17160, partial [Planctomycetes bacterium]|nr:hypothetical protein [Planctomycetota bacterium]